MVVVEEETGVVVEHIAVVLLNEIQDGGVVTRALSMLRRRVHVGLVVIDTHPWTTVVAMNNTTAIVVVVVVVAVRVRMMNLTIQVFCCKVVHAQYFNAVLLVR